MEDLYVRFVAAQIQRRTSVTEDALTAVGVLLRLAGLRAQPVAEPPAL